MITAAAQRAQRVRITFKAFATLGEYLPDEVDGARRSGNQIAIEVEEGTPVQAVIDRFRLPPGQVHLVLVNGAYVPPAQRAGRALRDGDALAVWPPIAGG
ncbi:MAG TPA: MoaD/ThiS family protein [Anaeromyxobacteraceae bacterium]|nr:MoaD/ThiS family protein [Anaeromyxobacteraceae bacterium]